MTHLRSMMSKGSDARRGGRRRGDGRGQHGSNHQAGRIAATPDRRGLRHAHAIQTPSPGGRLVERPAFVIGTDDPSGRGGGPTPSIGRRTHQNDRDRRMPGLGPRGHRDLESPRVEQREASAVGDDGVDRRRSNGLFDAPAPDRGIVDAAKVDRACDKTRIDRGGSRIQRHAIQRHAMQGIPHRPSSITRDPDGTHGTAASGRVIGPPPLKKRARGPDAGNPMTILASRGCGPCSEAGTVGTDRIIDHPPSGIADEFVDRRDDQPATESIIDPIRRVGVRIGIPIHDDLPAEGEPRRGQRS